MLLLTMYELFSWVFFSLFDFITDPVVELPETLQYALTNFASTIGQLINVMPWMGTIWTVFLIAMAVKITLFLLRTAFLVYQLVRG